MLEDFKKFALKGNVVDMAVGVIIGAAFGKIVSSFVGSVISPALGLLLGGVDLTGMKIVLKESIGEQPAVTIDYGVFLQSIVDFTIVAAAIFFAIRLLSSLDRRKKEDAPLTPPTPSAEVQLLTEIRDALKK